MNCAPAALLRDPKSGESRLLGPFSSSAWGWELLRVLNPADGANASAVIEHDFEEWAQLAFLGGYSKLG